MIATALMLTTAGCATLPPAEEEVPHAGGSGTCEASRASALIGREATSATGAEAMRLTGATALRWIQPGSMVTMDYRQDRLNVELDARNRITGFTCG